MQSRLYRYVREIKCYVAVLTLNMEKLLFYNYFHGQGASIASVSEFENHLFPLTTENITLFYNYVQSATN